jgi:hypothetical protein
MGTETRVEIVSNPVVGPGQRMVHGRIVGPVDEQYPPGTGGPLPRAANLVYDTVVVETTRDTNSGHTVRKQTPLDKFDTSEFSTEELASFNKAASKAKSVPGRKFLAGRPVLSGEEPAPVTAGRGAVAQGPAPAITPETQKAMDAHYWRLSADGQAHFRSEYPAYVPGPKPAELDRASENASGAASEAHTEVTGEEATTQEPAASEPAGETDAEKAAALAAANARRVKTDQSKVGK